MHYHVAVVQGSIFCKRLLYMAVYYWYTGQYTTIWLLYKAEYYHVYVVQGSI
ncbi:hypothetical protein DPMN_163090 [Dreissena polymorpha]|uniref:Uncharacterized protein n=1 Tax=Dreissena polymorpha TaxID=45954 RepID=A0A9D4ETA8_DREPO|nr:hypothetical protein DPMN_163090 [Dreissena polymorpha]